MPLDGRGPGGVSNGNAQEIDRRQRLLGRLLCLHHGKRSLELDKFSWKKRFFMAPEVKWLECNPKYVGKRPGQEEEEMKKKIPQKLVAYDAGLPSRIGGIRKDSYASVDRKLPPLSPFPKGPKRKPNKRKMFWRPDTSDIGPRSFGRSAEVQ